MTTIDPDRLAALDGIRLETGKHPARADGMCAMEAAAWLAGEPHSDQPACVDPVIGAFVRFWQDRLDERWELLVKPLIPLLVGTRSTQAVEHARAIACADWAIRHVLPTWLRLTPSLVEHADALAGLPELTVDALKDARKMVVSAAESAWVAAEAAWAAGAARSAWAAAEAAAEAAEDAAGAAAEAAWAAGAAWAAAAADAADAARSAGAAARSAWAAGADRSAGEVRKAAHQLQADTVTFIHRLINIGEQQ